MTVDISESRSAPPSRSIWDELDVWSKTFAPWQRLLLASAVRSGSIPTAAVEHAYALFLADHDLAPAPSPAPDVPSSVTGRTAYSGRRVRLRKIHSLSGINRLPFASELTFADGLTIIYGGNGTGKSGFARILSNACFSRQQHPIYPDIFQTSAPSSSSASIEISDETGGAATLAFDGVTEHAALRRGFVVFDSAVALKHLKDAGPMGFTPTGFDVFAEMAHGYSAMQAKLQADIHRRTHENAFPSSFIGQRTLPSAAAAELNQFTDLERLRALAVFGDAEKARLEQLQSMGDQLRAKDPDAAIRRLVEVRPHLVGLREKYSAAVQSFSEERLAGDIRLVNSLANAALVLSNLSAEKLGHSSLKGTGSADWQRLISAAQDLVGEQHVHYPGEGDVCLLCHQALGKEARELFLAYRRFISGDDRKTVQELADRVAERRRELVSTNLGLVEEGTIAQSFLKEANPPLLNALNEVVAKLTTLRESAVGVLDRRSVSATTVALPDLDTALEDALSALDHDLVLLRQSDVPAALKAIEDERTEVRHRQVLSQLLDQMVSFVRDARWVAGAEAARAALNPRHITEKEQELFGSVVADHYREMLASECQELNCDVPVEFRVQGRRGQSVRSLLVGNRSPDDILSEGEQRAVAIADFLTEIGLNEDNAGVVLDDPVTSLDHERRELVAGRLVREAAKRQVIIFTHDLIFFTKICEAAADAGQPITMHYMQKSADGTPGLITPNDGPVTTPHYRDTSLAEQTLGKAKLASGSSQDAYVRQGAGQLRRTIEEMVPQFLFKQVVTRWTDRVIVTALKKVNWDNSLADEIIEVFEACSAIMEGHSHTEAGIGAPPTIANLEGLIERIKGLLRQAKTERR